MDLIIYHAKTRWLQHFSPIRFMLSPQHGVLATIDNQQRLALARKAETVAASPSWKPNLVP